MGGHILRCTECSSKYHGPISRCEHDDALLRTEYFSRELRLTRHIGLWKFLEWLPVHGVVKEFKGGSITYRSEHLAKELGVHNLYISFNGYWPERNACLSTCSFKDLEASPTIQRLMENGRNEILVVASAGNTARSFAHISSLTGYPLVLIVPTTSMEKLWLPNEDDLTGSIFVIAVDGDYSDAISFGDTLASQDGFMAEGGARNVARRDGMGTVMLEASLSMGSLPAHYFQAVGSGTGGIAAWEAAERLVLDGRFGDKLPMLQLAQNVPCAPIYSLVHGSNGHDPCPEDMFDRVLFNRRPPFLLKGGVADALNATGGTVWGITNADAEDAMSVFQEAEGIDIMPAAAIAVAALRNAVDSGRIRPAEKILLNVTGGGERRLKEDNDPRRLDRNMVVSGNSPDLAYVTERIKEKLLGW